MNALSKFIAKRKDRVNLKWRTRGIFWLVSAESSSLVPGMGMCGGYRIDCRHRVPDRTVGVRQGSGLDRRDTAPPPPALLQGRMQAGSCHFRVRKRAWGQRIWEKFLRGNRGTNVFLQTVPEPMLNWKAQSYRSPVCRFLFCFLVVLSRVDEGKSLNSLTMESF